MEIERKPLFRFLLEAFASNEKALGYLQQQPVYGRKLGDNIPNPKVDREEYAFEMSDRLIRWGYAAEFLRAMMEDEDVVPTIRRRAAELLGKDPREIKDPPRQVAVAPAEGQQPPPHTDASGERSQSGATFVFNGPVTLNHSQMGAGTLHQENRASTQTTPLTSTRAPEPPPRTPPRMAAPVQLWELWLEPLPIHPGWSREVRAWIEQILGEGIPDFEEVVADEEAPEPLLLELTRDQAKRVQNHLKQSNGRVGASRAVACHPRAARDAGVLYLEAGGTPRVFRLGWGQGYSDVQSGELTDPAGIQLPEEPNGALPPEPLPEALRWYFEDYSQVYAAGDGPRAERAIDEAHKWGFGAYGALGHTPTAKRWLQTAHVLRIVYSNDKAGWQSWPWEFVRQSRFAAFEQLCVERGVPAPLSPPERRANDGAPLRILLISPRGTKSAEAVGYQEVSQTLLEQADQARVAVEVYELSPATVAQLEALKNQGQHFDLVHFDGHGSSGGKLHFEDPQPGKPLIPVECGILATTLRQMGVTLAVLTSCRSGGAGQAGARLEFASSAAVLAAALGEAVAFGWNLHPTGAKMFTRGFYSQLFSSAPEQPESVVRKSTLTGRQRMAADDRRQRQDRILHLQDRWTVRHYVSRPSTLPLRPCEPQPIQRIPEDWMRIADPDPGLSRFGFVGRDQKLHTLVRFYTATNAGAAVLWGPTGVGKTTLLRWWILRLYRTHLLGQSAAGHLICTSASTVQSFYEDLLKRLPNQPTYENTQAMREGIARSLPHHTLVVWEDAPADLFSPIGKDDLEELRKFVDRLATGRRKLLITTDAEPLDVRGFYMVLLPPMSEGEAIQLVRNIAETQGKTFDLNEPSAATNSPTDSGEYLPLRIVQEEGQVADFSLDFLRRLRG